jgi:hypothetical protein
VAGRGVGCVAAGAGVGGDEWCAEVEADTDLFNQGAGGWWWWVADLCECSVVAEAEGEEDRGGDDGDKGDEGPPGFVAVAEE